MTVLEISLGHPAFSNSFFTASVDFFFSDRGEHAYERSPWQDEELEREKHVLAGWPAV